MHRVEIRLTHEGTDVPSADFEVYNEILKDGKYVELAPMRAVASGGAPLVLFLEANERVIVVAKGDTGRMVYDREQNANVRVETEAEIKDREAREANLKKAQEQASRPIEPVQPQSPKPTLTPTPNTKPGVPASANTGPKDSHQVKNG